MKNAARSQNHYWDGGANGGNSNNNARIMHPIRNLITTTRAPTTTIKIEEAVTIVEVHQYETLKTTIHTIPHPKDTDEEESADGEYDRDDEYESGSSEIS